MVCKQIMLVLAVLTDPGGYCLAIGQRCGFGGAHRDYIGRFGGGAAHIEPNLGLLPLLGLLLRLLLTSLS